MRISISNIAWDVSEDEIIANLLTEFGIDAIDIAPGKYFPDPQNTTENAIKLVKNWWSERGFSITGMQALLFGTKGLNLFASSEIQQAMLDHLNAVCAIGAGLGASHLVFGSPKNRDRTGISDDKALDFAISFFQRLGDLAKAHSVVICLEPNPICYGANFMTTSVETANIVKQVNHEAIKMQLDTGALTLNSEKPAQIIENFASIIGHIHASEPNLLPLGDANTNHRAIHKVLSDHLPHHVVAIEMLATQDEPHSHSIQRALQVAIQEYRP